VRICKLCARPSGSGSPACANAICLQEKFLPTALIQLAKGEISELIEAKDDEKSGQKSWN